MNSSFRKADIACYIAKRKSIPLVWSTNPTQEARPNVQISHRSLVSNLDMNIYSKRFNWVSIVIISSIYPCHDNINLIAKLPTSHHTVVRYAIFHGHRRQIKLGIFGIGLKCLSIDNTATSTDAFQNAWACFH